jgi:hypothetical protein
MLDMDREGNLVFAWNDNPTFHDISGVEKPAERICFGLRKVAFSRVLSGAELAEIERGFVIPSLRGTGQHAKYAARRNLLSKMADMEKRVLLESVDGPTKNVACAFHDDAKDPLDEAELTMLRAAVPESVFEGLGERKILLSPEEFYKMLLGDDYREVEEHMPEVRSLVPNMYGCMRDEIEPSIDDGSYEPGGPVLDRSLRNVLDGMIGGHSLFEEPVKARVIKITISMAPKRFMNVKTASEASAAARYLTKEYAKYQLSFLNRNNDDRTAFLTLAHNMANVLL